MSTELAWAAGFLDGDGNFGFTPRSPGWRGRGQLIVQAGQVRREPLDRLVAVLGGTVRGPYADRSRLGGQPQHQWSITDFSKAFQTICDLWPYLSEPKREQVKRTLSKAYAYRKANPVQAHWCSRKTHCKSGHSFDDANTRLTEDGRRHCRACERLRARRRRFTRKAQLRYDENGKIEI